MRLMLTILGVASVIAYALLGAGLMTNWAVVAGSEVPLDEAIAAMRAANQPYSTASGVIFAGVGTALALAWAAAVLRSRTKISGWGAVTLWAGIIMLGAPAYFFASFGNMNSVGDTFYDWNSEAAWATEQPLYMISGAATLIAAIALCAAVSRASREPATASDRRGVAGIPRSDFGAPAVSGAGRPGRRRNCGS
ncbi:MAG: hypothetical protein QM708_15015 [Propioniciclava sp.]|uniref:hypothetical protein n=1 Tax=Propioniciclava sp. TaxID=2038686 RepID=UPI0039E649DC